MLAVHEIQDKRAKKNMQGTSTKEGRGLMKSIGRKKAAMLKLLDEMHIWKVAGRNESVDVHRLSDELINEMMKSPALNF
jgi:hypothetical protein